MKKTELRKIYLERRENQGDQKDKLDRSILKNFLSGFSFIGKQLIHIYIPIEKFQEINTYLFISEFKERGHRICVPRIRLDRIQSIEINEKSKWVENSWNIKEPKEGKEIKPEDIDVIIVPLLAYDAKGFRVGYGKGFYDRYLSNCRKDILKIGLSYFTPVDHIDDLDNNDIPLDFCVTPEKIYEF